MVGVVIFVVVVEEVSEGSIIRLGLFLIESVALISP